MNLSPSGFLGCSVTFAIHLMASMVSRRPIVSLLLTAMLGGALALSLASRSAPAPPPPPTPSVPPIAYLKTGE